VLWNVTRQTWELFITIEKYNKAAPLTCLSQLNNFVIKQSSFSRVPSYLKVKKPN